MKACHILLAALIVACIGSAFPRAPERETVVVNTTKTSDSGFSIQQVDDGVKVFASSLDGNGLYEGAWLQVMKNEVTGENAEEALDDHEHEVRSEEAEGSEYVFKLTDEEMKCSLIVISYNIGKKGGVETVRQYLFPTSLFLKKRADKSPEATPGSVTPAASAPAAPLPSAPQL